jgi:hypothetical protein
MRSRLCGLVLLLGLVTPFAAHAFPITYTWAGTITAVDSGLSGAFSVGGAVSGSMTIDSTTVDFVAGDPTFGSYASNDSYAYVAGGYVATVHSTLVQVTNGAPDRLFVYGTTVTGANVGSYVVQELQLTLEDLQGTAFASDGLPTALSLADFETRTAQLFFFDFGVGGGAAAVTATLTSFTVPEPAGLGGFALAGAALARIRRRGASATP